MPGYRPVKREPALTLTRSQRAVPLDAAHRLRHPPIDRDLPYAPIASARTQHPSVRLENKVAHVRVREGVGKVCPAGSSVETLVHAEVGCDPHPAGIRGVNFD